MDRTEQLIVERLKANDEKAWHYLFDRHYAVLCHIASQYVHDDFLAETIVGDVILHFWEVRADVDITTSLRSYLATSVRHRCLDWLKSRRTCKEISVLQSLAGSFPSLGYISSDDYPLGRLLEGELEGEIMKAIELLPPMCRRVFSLSRIEGLSNEAVAKQLGLSINSNVMSIYHLCQYITCVDILLVSIYYSCRYITHADILHNVLIIITS